MQLRTSFCINCWQVVLLWLLRLVISSATKTGRIGLVELASIVCAENYHHNNGLLVNLYYFLIIGLDDCRLGWSSHRANGGTIASIAPLIERLDTLAEIFLCLSEVIAFLLQVLIFGERLAVKKVNLMNHHVLIYSSSSRGNHHRKYLINSVLLAITPLRMPKLAGSKAWQS